MNLVPNETSAAKGRQKVASSLEQLVNRMHDKDSIINGISDAIMLLDAKTYKILEVNQAFLNSYRSTLDQVIGKTCHEITHRRPEPCPDKPGSPCPLRDAFLNRGISRTEHVHKDAAGHDLFFEIAAYPVKDPNGDISRVVHMSRDVTERRRYEEALKERVTRSEHLAALGRVVSEITHEIKNPLMMIGGLASQLLRASDDEGKSKKLTIVIEEVARLENLLANLREHYVPKAVSYKRVDVRGLLEKLYHLVRDECERRGVRINFELEGADMAVWWDPNKLEQVFLNVFKNSMEAMENGGILTIKAGLRDGNVEVVVKDNGCGIPKAHLDKITDCFFTTKSRGSGLGLCISKKFIDEHRGSSFSIESESGKGTTVRIGLPVSGEFFTSTMKS